MKFETGYDKHLDANIQNQVYQYDGKIAGIQWRFRHTNGVALAKQAYRLKYNFQDMLTEAEYFEAAQSGFTGRYKATFNYIDQRGNFDVITRNNAVVQIDNLDYSYKSGSNQLEAINDGTSSSYSRGYISNQNQYQHNANGYITYDAEIGANIIRDHLNHINYLEYDTIKITHQRDASGQLYRTIYDSAGITTTIDRCGMLEFRNGVLGLVHHNNGYVTFNRTVPDELLLEGTVSHTKTEEAVHIISNRILNNGADEENIAEGGIVLRPEFEVKEGAEYLADLQKFPIQSLAWHYIIRDHLGSPRVTFQDINNDGNIQTQTEIEDNKNYYPFGLEWDDPEAGVPKFRKSYNDKEAISYTNYLAFEARNYIRSASVFDGPDPVNKDFPFLTSGNYAANNPINMIDPDGRMAVPAQGPDDIIFLDGNNNELFRIQQEGAHQYFSGIDRVESPVRISFRAGVDQDVVSVLSLNTLQDIGLESRVFDIDVTSTSRDALGQATAMYDNLIRDYDEQRGLYREPGQQVIDAYDAAVEQGLDSLRLCRQRWDHSI